MYGLVPYNLSKEQKMIQYGHALQEMNNAMNGWVSDYIVEPTLFEKFKKWALEDKTFIVLSGGTTNNNLERLGTLNQHLITLKERYNIDGFTFHEPDLGDQLTGVLFLVDERVWDKKKYPDPPIRGDYQEGEFMDFCMDFEKAITAMGGTEIYELRNFLNGFRLA